MRCALIAGARPQFIKAAALLPALREKGETLFWHTGQHSDPRMSADLFEDLALPEPDLHLDAAGEDRLRTMAFGLRAEIERTGVDRIVVMGDTDSTVAGALAAEGRLLVHVEAGCRSGEADLPEEKNRILVDAKSGLLLCSTQADADNLAGRDGVHVVGDVMADLLYAHEQQIRERAPRGEPYAVLTLHRAGTVDDPAKVDEVLNGVAAVGMRIVLPVHPRLKRTAFPAPVEPVPPMPYREFLALVAGASLVLTDSGGLQKEAYLLGVPCITLRRATEWKQTVHSGWNVLAGPDAGGIRRALDHEWPRTPPEPLFGDGHASSRIAALVREAGSASS
ncbi:MAG: UDP-N-acetyl glucosamine 2-epimerase [Planctomycetota bacterium]